MQLPASSKSWVCVHKEQQRREVMRILWHFQSFRAYIQESGNRTQLKAGFLSSYLKFWERQASFINCDDPLKGLHDLHNKVPQSITASKVSLVYTNTKQSNFLSYWPCVVWIASLALSLSHGERLLCVQNLFFCLTRLHTEPAVCLLLSFLFSPCFHKPWVLKELFGILSSMLLWWKSKVKKKKNPTK